MYVKRSVTDKLRKLVKAFPVVVVSGARQVGKTTLLRHVFPDLDYVAFDVKSICCLNGTECSTPSRSS